MASRTTGGRSTRLATRLTIATLVLLLPLYLVLLAGYVSDQRARRTSEIANSLVLGRLAATVVEGFRRDLYGTVLAASIVLGDQQRPIDQATVGSYLNTISSEYPALRALFITDPNGRVVASQQASGVGTDLTGRPYITALQAGVTSTWSGGLAGLQSGQPTIVHGRAIRGQDGAVRGFMLAAFQPQAFIDRLPIELTPDAGLVLIDDTGQVLYASDSTPLDALENVGDSPLVRAAMAGNVQQLDGQQTPFASGPVYGALVPVGTSGWVVAYTRPVAGLESELRARLLQQALAMTLVLGAAAIVIAYLTRRLLRPLRMLAGAAGSVARGERAQVGVTSGDAEVVELARAMDDMSRAVAQREDALRDETQLVETLHTVGEALAAELVLEKLVQAVTDAATHVTGAEFGAFFYNLSDDRAAPFQYTVSGVSRDIFADLPVRDLIGADLAAPRVVRLDDITAESPALGASPFASFEPPVHAYLAVPVFSRSGDVLGSLFFGHRRPAVFTERAERLATGIAAGAAVALDNARLYRQAQEAIHLRDQFVSIASHELRTPLAAIKATAQSTLRAQARGTLDAERIDRSLRAIVTTTDHVARLSSDLLDVTRLQAGTLPMVREPIVLSEMLQSLAAAFRDQWEDAHELTLEPRTEYTTVQGDPDRLQQVFTNLFDNAGKYSAAGSPIHVTLDDDQDGVCIAVADRGIGLPDGAATALFEPFQRAPKALARQIRGLGLGLYIARQVVEAHGGRIWAESGGDDQGATFFVWLPAQPRPQVGS